MIPRLRKSLRLDHEDVPAYVESEEDNYLFLNSAGALTLRNKQGDMALAGSEFIESLEFTVPVNVTKSGDNYLNAILTMSIGAKAASSAKTDVSAQYGATLDIPLYNRPSRAGPEQTGRIAAPYYSGTALKFIAAAEELDFNIIVDYFFLSDAAKSDAELDKSAAFEKGGTLKAVYGYHLSEEPGYETIDASSFRWYISGASDAQTDTIETAPPTSSNRESGYWELVSESGEAPAAKTLPTSGDFYVKTEGGAVKWGGYGVIRCRLTPVVTKPDGSGKKTGAAIWSPYVTLEKKKSSAKDIFSDMKEWISRMGKETSDSFPINAESARVVVEGDESYIQIQQKEGLEGSAVMAKIAMPYLKDVVGLSKEGGISYSSPANISVIVDVLVDSSASGFGLLLCGIAEKEGAVYKDSGYMFQYDKRADGFPIRLFAGGRHSINDTGGNESSGAFGVKNIETHGSFTGENDGYGPYYGPGYLKTSNFLYNSGTDKNCPWRLRRRVMFTILEYYTTDRGAPQYIVRMKYLKNAGDAADPKDPFACGKDYFFSNPAWYGSFEGQDVDGSRQNRPAYGRLYTYSPFNYMENLWKNPSIATQWNLYITRSPRATAFSSLGHVAGVFQGKNMNIRSDIAGTSYYGEPASSLVSAAAARFADPKRERLIGFRVWGSAIKEGTKLYNITLAPGFTKTELRAILPAGAKLYELSDLLSDSEYQEIKKSPEAFGFLNADELSASYNSIFGKTGQSNGIGNGSGVYNGVNGIQYQLNRNGTSGAWYGFEPDAK